MSDQTTKAPDSAADMTASYSTRIGLITDVHWTPDVEEEITELLQSTLGHFNTSNVDHIVVLGDLIIEGETSTETRKRFHSLVNQIRDKSECPVTVLRGNHDVITGDGDPVTDLSLAPEKGTIELADDITGIFLDTSSPQWPDARGELGEEQLSFLDTALETAENAVVFAHHPLYYHDLDGTWFEEHPEAAFCLDKYRANEVFNGHDNILAVVNGHTHLSNHDVYNDVPHFTVNAFNYESPENTDPNGSFAVMEVSPSRVKRISHRHGNFSGIDDVRYPAGNQTVALGGTFGPIHDGHRQMFQRAFEVGDVMIGLTSDELAQQTRHTERDVPSFEDRHEHLEDELNRYAEMYDREYEIKELTDPMGYVADDPEFTHLIVSPETFSRGENVNEARLENGLEPMTLEVVDPVLAEDGKRISSTRICNGEIDEHGVISED